MKLARAIAGASLCVPTLFFLVAAVNFYATAGEAPYDWFDAPLGLSLRAVILVWPLAIALVAIVIAPLTWFYRKRGYASRGFMIAAGGIAGTMCVLLFYLYQQVGRFAGYSYEVHRMGGSTAFEMALLFGVGGAITSAVYWLLLDPPSYYRRP